MSKEIVEIVEYAQTSLRNECSISRVYDRLSQMYRLSDTYLSNQLKMLAKEEQEHADFWTTFLTDKAVKPIVRIPRYRTTLLTYLSKLLGVGLTLKVLEISERDAIQHYSLMIQNPNISNPDKAGIYRILEDELKHEEDLEAYSAKFKFFVNKVATINSQLSYGLVSILSVSTGFASVYTNNIDIIIPSVIVGITGAISTISGFYFFGRIQNIVTQGILSRLKLAIEAVPHVFTDRVFKYMAKKQVSEDTAKTIADEASRNMKYLQNVIAEEEYGIKASALSNPLESAVYAGLFRIIGTFLPLTPYVLGFPVSTAIILAVLITLTLLTMNGFLVALAAELDVKQKVLELTFSGLVLASIAFSIGQLAAVLKSVLS